MEAFLDGEWDSLSKLFSCEDSDLLLHCNSSNLVSYDCEIDLSHASENVGANMLLPCNNLDSFYSVSQESSHNSSEIESSLFAFLGDEDRPVAANAAGFNNAFDQSMITDDLMEEILQLKASMLCNDQLQNEGALIRPKESDDSCNKKRPRQASKRNAESTKRAKRGAKTSNNVEEEVKNNGSSSSCCSEGDDCNPSEELNGGSTSESTTTKKKATKSPATDPQSLYARKRRERINERLRILQNLVPNGTKVDISTMLEEAVDYVKFLQLQIKLLSSDDMWMYAPIAYNGMDMGLYQRIIPNL